MVKVHGGPVAVPVVPAPAATPAAAVVDVACGREGRWVAAPSARGARRHSRGGVPSGRGGREERGVKSSQIIAAEDLRDYLSDFTKLENGRKSY